MFIEPNDQSVLDNCDNITVAPWGDLILCEDLVAEPQNSGQFLVGVTPAGACYKFGRNAVNDAELAGCCFSPDGSILFVNIYDPGITLAITGPWQKR